MLVPCRPTSSLLSSNNYFPATYFFVFVLILFSCTLRYNVIVSTVVDGDVAVVVVVFVVVTLIVSTVVDDDVSILLVM